MTTCHCPTCTLGRLQGIHALLMRGRTAMAGTALASVITELAGHIAASTAPPAPRHQVEHHAEPKPHLRNTATVTPGGWPACWQSTLDYGGLRPRP